MKYLPTISRAVLTPAIIGSMLVLSAPAMADVKDGVDAWGRGDYKTAVGEWQGPASAGDPDAQFNLAQAYKLGRGVPMSLAEAERWYKRAANQGHLQANDNYGLILFQAKRRSEALPYLQTSANRGEPRAQYVLGTGHFNGDFVEKDWIKAYALMNRASAQGLPQATSNLAQMDKYIPLDDRRRALELAGQMEQNEKRVRTAQVGGLRPAPTAGAVQTAQLPPSRAVAPVPVPQPVTPASAPAPVRTPAPVTVAAPAPIPAATGDWRIQLGAFGDQNKARNLWTSLENRVSALRQLQPYLVKSGNITRLQAGPFSTRQQADRMCGTVKSTGNACIVKKR